MKRVQVLIIVAAAVALFYAGRLPAAQRTFVSAANGFDTNPCNRLSPCRNFAAAIPLTDPDGEVVVLDSGGYGAVTVTQPVSLIGTSGVYAGITAFSGNAITVTAGDSANVVLRNLFLNAQGGDTGIAANTVAALYVESCVISGFVSYGVSFSPTSTNARLYVSNSTIRRASTGITVMGGTGIRATLDSVRLHKNDHGVFAQSADVTIRKSVASGGSQGFWSGGSARLTIEDSVATDNAYGFYSNGGVIMMTRSAATSNGIGVIAQFNPATIYVSDSTIAANTLGVSTLSSGIVTSRGNNTLQANTTDGAFSSTFGPN
jgi:copper-binding protein NosD